MVLSGIMWLLKTGIGGNDIPYEYGPYKNKTLFNRFLRLAKTGIFENIFNGISKKLGKAGSLLMDSMYCKAHAHHAA
jgi:transposase